MTCQYPGSDQCGDIGTAVSLHGGVLPMTGMGIVAWLVVGVAAVVLGAAWLAADAGRADRGLVFVFTVGLVLAVALAVMGQVAVALFTVVAMAVAFVASVDEDGGP
jgi:hypothetical protein